MTTNQQLVSTFLAGWGQETMYQVFDSYLDDECVWLNTGFRPLEGKAACLGFLDALVAWGSVGIDVEVLNMAGQDDVVFVERIDRCLDSSGGVVVAADVAGVLHVKDGKIVRWHDYFDPTPFKHPLERPGPVMQ